MATKYSVRICFKGKDSESVALLADTTPLDCIIDFVDSLWSNGVDWHGGECNLKWVDCIDMDTGEVVYDRSGWDESDLSDDDDCDDDPYMGVTLMTAKEVAE